LFEIIAEDYSKEVGIEFSVLRFPHVLDVKAERFPESYRVLYELIAHAINIRPYEIKCRKDKEFQVISSADAVRAIV